MGAYGGLGERCKTQLRLNAPIIFFGPEAGTISTFDHRTSICSPSIRSPAWNRTDLCTSDHHFGMTHGRKNVSPSRNPCESDPRKLGLYQHSITAHRSVRLQFVHLHGTAPISVRVITTSVSLTAERLFRLQGTHVIPILFWSQFTIDVRLRTHTDHFFRAEARTDPHQWRQISCSLFYLLLSVGSLEHFWNVITLELRASFLAGGLHFRFF